MLTNTQTNRLASTETLVQVLQEEQAAYAADKPLQRLVAELATWVTDLKPLRRQVLLTPGTSAGTATDDKSESKLLLATLAAEVGGDALAYAAEKHKPALLAAADHGTSELERMRDSVLVTTATELRDAAKAELQANPQDFGEYLTPERLADLDAALAAFDAEKTAPQAEKTSGQGARTSLRTQFKALSALTADRLRPLMRKYKRSNPAFWQRVEAAASIVNHAATHATATPKPTPITPA